jgi:hypothetical protein
VAAAQRQVGQRVEGQAQRFGLLRRHQALLLPQLGQSVADEERVSSGPAESQGVQ